MKKLFIMGALWLILSNLANAQALKIGDKVPDFNIGEIINYPQKSLRFSNIKARLIILDYWSTRCASCIAALPKIDMLQKRFKDEVLILPATNEKRELIKAFWVRNAFSKSTDLPTIVEDTLQRYFPHSGTPYHVWILDGKVFAMPNTSYTNENDIRDVLDGISKDWAEKPTGKNTEVDITTPLLKPDKPKIKMIGDVTYSTLLKSTNIYIVGIGRNFGEKKRKYTKVLYRNHSILELYKNAYNHIFNQLGIPETLRCNLVRYPNRRILEVNALEDYISLNTLKDLEWQRDHSFDYESISKGAISEMKMGEYMLSDLNRFLTLNGRIEKRNVICWILTLQPEIKLIKDNVSKSYLAKQAKIEELKKQDSENGNFLKYLDEIGKLPFSENLYSDISSEIGTANPIIIDETYYSIPYKITMKLPNREDRQVSFEELKAELNKHGFELKKEIREIDMFVLTENNYKVEL